MQRLTQRTVFLQTFIMFTLDPCPRNGTLVAVLGQVKTIMSVKGGYTVHKISTVFQKFTAGYSTQHRCSELG